METACEIEDLDSNKLISKMEKEYKSMYAPCTDINLQEELNREEQYFGQRHFN